jgi:hypothetical protein
VLDANADRADLELRLMDQPGSRLFSGENGPG